MTLHGLDGVSPHDDEVVFEGAALPPGAPDHPDVPAPDDARGSSVVLDVTHDSGRDANTRDRLAATLPEVVQDPTVKPVKADLDEAARLPGYSGPWSDAPRTAAAAPVQPTTVPPAAQTAGLPPRAVPPAIRASVQPVPAAAAPIAASIPTSPVAAPAAPDQRAVASAPVSVPHTPPPGNSRPTRAQRLTTALHNLLRTSEDVEEAALVSLDGFTMASALSDGMHEDRVGAMSAAIVGLGERAAMELGRGALSQVFIEGEAGYVLLMAAGDRAVLTVLARRDARLGLLLYDMREAAETVAKILG